MAAYGNPGQPPAWCANRRALLAGLGGVGAAALLTACGGSPAAKSPANESQGQGQGQGQAQGQTQAAPPTEAPPAELAETSAVPVGGGIVSNGLLIVQPVSGTFKAFDAACPHKGILVSAPQNGVATCPAHASKFNIADGSRIDGPTPTGLKEIAVKVEGTRIVRE